LAVYTLDAEDDAEEPPTPEEGPVAVDALLEDAPPPVALVDDVPDVVELLADAAELSPLRTRRLFLMPRTCC
jgi:hypothetical protein